MEGLYEMNLPRLPRRIEKGKAQALVSSEGKRERGKNLVRRFFGLLGGEGGFEAH